MDADAASLISLMPYAERLGVHIEEAGSSRVVGHLKWAADLCTAGGILHGGALMSLADSIGAVCAFLNLPEGASRSTIESKTNFFRGVRSGRAIATAAPVHVGRTTIAVQTELHDEAEKLVGLVLQTQAVTPSAG